MMKYKYSVCFIACLFALSSSFVHAESESIDYIEFDPSFLRQSNDQVNIDLSAFSHSNPITAGIYSADIFINQHWIGRDKIVFIDNPENKAQAKLCLTPRLIETIGIEPSLFNKKIDEAKDDECLTINTGDELIRFDFSTNELRLDASVPQGYLVSRPRGYVSPALWDSGVSSAFVSYRVNQYESRNQGKTTNHGSLNTNLGINLSQWHLRHSGNFNWGSDQNSKYSVYETYLQTDIPLLRSQFKVGDVYASSELFDSHSFRGLQISSDDRMLPASQRGYAPVINGYANSNSMVRITQNGREIYNETVPAGPFVIDDLYPTSFNGDLLVTITESDGSTRSFSVPYSSIQQLIRPGFSQYEFTVGKLRSGSKLYDEKGIQGMWRYGITNTITGNSGFIIGDNYRSGVLGAAFSTSIGAFSFDTTYARSQFKHQDDKSGLSYRLAFSRKLVQTNTNISLAAYRYTTEGFYSWDQVANINKSVSNSYSNYRPKEQFQLSLYQSFPDGWGSTYLVANNRRYWNKSGNENSWSMGYSNNWKTANYSFSFSNSKYSDEDKWRKEFTFYVSFPFDFGTKYPAFINAQVNKVNGGSTNSTLGINGSFGDDSQYSYGLSGNHSSQTDVSNSLSANLSARTSITSLSATYGQQEHSSQWSLGASGAIVLHQGGVTATNQLSDTYAIVYAKDAACAKVLNGQNIRLDSRGYAVISSLSPYEVNTVSIDPKGLPINVQLKSTQQQIVPRANSSVFIELETSNQKTVLFDIKDQKGNPIPANASIVDHDGNMLGIFGAGGRILLEGITEQGLLHIMDSNNNNICVIPYSLNEGERKILNNNIQLISLSCS